MSRLRLLPLRALLPLALPAAEPEKKKPTPKEALQAVHDLIGEWKGTGNPSQGTAEEKRKNFWVEDIRWRWRFKGDDCWLETSFGNSKNFSRGELHYLPGTGRYRLTL